MDSQQVKAAAVELLGYRVTERENDAVVEFFEEGKNRVRAVRPATAVEAGMFVRILGFIARLDEATEALRSMEAVYAEQRTALNDALAASQALEKAVELGASALQAADAQIQELAFANNECRVEIERLNGECDTLLSQRDAAAQESASARLLNEELRAEVKDLRELIITVEEK